MLQNKLAMCTDEEKWLSPPSPPSQEPWPPSDWPSGWPPLGEGEIELQRPCVEQFADRTVFATCSNDSPASNRFVFSVRTHYYEGSVYLDDVAMTACLRVHGTWWRMDMSDPRARLAKAEAEVEQTRARMR